MTTSLRMNGDPAPTPCRRRVAGRSWSCALASVLCALLTALTPAAPARAQPAAYTQAELEQALAPIALYPDALLAQVLIAASYPTEVWLAADWVQRNPQFKDQGDAAVRAVDNEQWDASVKSLVAFPQVLEMLDTHRDWTQQVGDAFVTQRAATMSAVQSLRVQADLAGNLQSTSQVTVVKEQNTIVIQPANPQVVYVPSYSPAFVYGTWPYPAYPPYYLPPPPGYYVGSAIATGIAFGIGLSITNAIWGGFDWRRNDVNININHFNNIHVNHRQNYPRDSNRWEHDRSHRGNVPYNDPVARERVQKTALGTHDRADHKGFERPSGGRPDARPAPAAALSDRDRTRPGVPATRPAVPDRGAFEGIDRPLGERPQIDRGQALANRPAPVRPTAETTRPAPTPAGRPAARPAAVPSRPTPPPARPAPPTARPAARPAPRPAAPRPAAPRPAARPAAGRAGHAR
jgi:hypothetical protein